VEERSAWQRFLEVKTAVIRAEEKKELRERKFREEIRFLMERIDDLNRVLKEMDPQAEIVDVKSLMIKYRY
jgi:hypothetical protein